MLLDEDHPDDPGPPGRVLTPHRDRGGNQVGVSPPHLVRATPGVIGRDRGGTGPAEAGDQLPDRIGIEPQVGGDGVGLMAAAEPPEDHLPLGYGNGSSHSGPPRQRPREWTDLAPHQTMRRHSGKLGVRIPSGQLDVA
jgi:hypothetical protein